MYSFEEAAALLREQALKQALANVPRRTVIEGTRIIRGLYQGWAPPTGPMLRQKGIDAIILCAGEWQAPHFADPLCAAALGWEQGTDPYPGVQIIHAPADDDFSRPPPEQAIEIATRAAVQAARILLRGGRVLSSCWMGKNRSGLVTALTLHGLTGLSGAHVLAHIRKVRPQALSNPQFRAAIMKIRATQPLQLPGVSA